MLCFSFHRLSLFQNSQVTCLNNDCGRNVIFHLQLHIPWGMITWAQKSEVCSDQNMTVVPMLVKLHPWESQRTSSVKAEWHASQQSLFVWALLSILSSAVKPLANSLRQLALQLLPTSVHKLLLSFLLKWWLGACWLAFLVKGELVQVSSNVWRTPRMGNTRDLHGISCNWKDENYIWTGPLNKKNLWRHFLRRNITNKIGYSS